ncbi:hypothetical protein H5410_009044, partial [Solanum commersonii]
PLTSLVREDYLSRGICLNKQLEEGRWSISGEHVASGFESLNLHILRYFQVNPYFESVKMKFMKLGSKPNQFQTKGDNIRYVATELATDMVINVGDVKFYLHKVCSPSQAIFVTLFSAC